MKVLAIYSALLAVLGSTAHGAGIWHEHPALPPWLERGELAWAINYSGMNARDIDFMVGVGENLIQGGSFRAGADDRLKAAGARRMQYICSRTIYWRGLFKSRPQLEQATIRTPDNKHLVIYKNAERYAGCYNKREWLDYIISLVDKLSAAGNDAIFFDNPMVWPCYCETCQEKFRAYAQSKIGRAIPIPKPDEREDVQAIEAAKLFRLESAERFFRAVHEHARQKQPRVYITANNLCYWLVSRGVTDMVFTEAFAHPPFGRQISPYKVGLAASGGKPTGVLAYPPMTVRAARGKKIWHEPGKRYLSVAPPLPLEYSLGAAEGIACGGNYICNYGVSIGRPITGLDRPTRSAIAGALKPYRQFKRKYAKYFKGTRPGSRTGYVFDWHKELRGGSILGRDLRTFDAAAGRFMAAGLAVDVLTERNLESSELSDFDVLIFDDLPVLSRPAAASVGRFVRAGGGLWLAGGPPKVRDLFEAPEKADTLACALGHLSLPQAFRFDPKDFQLDGYELEHGSRLKVPKAGRAWVEFRGPAGVYSILISYLDENDGQGEAAAFVDDSELDRWTFDADDNGMKIRRVGNVNLKPGSRVEIRAKSGGGEYGRIYGMRIIGGGLPEPAVCRVGKGRVVLAADPIASTPPKTLASTAALAAGGSVRYRVIDPPRDLLLNVLDVPDARASVLHLVNYRVEYEKGYANPRVIAAKDVVVEMKLAGPAPNALLLTVEGEPLALRASSADNAWRVTVPEVRIYAAVVIAHK